jgi:putative restriction endonuclease
MTHPTSPGTDFASRADLAKAGIHRQHQAGIAWTLAERAYSIVLSGGYEDDEDRGSVIIYTGEGGRDSNTGAQIADQQLLKGNLALAQSKHEGRLIHVTRGANHKSLFSPKTGYRYAGTYIIEDYWQETGRSGHQVYRFRLIAANIDTNESIVAELPATERRTYQSERIVRDTKQALAIKQLYNYTCQVCGIRIDLPLGLKYAEGAHIRPLGRPHDGPDHLSNLLCLCPNHHVMFDNYVFSVDPNDYSLIGSTDGTLLLRDGHDIDTENFRYHNKLYNIKNN